MKFSVILAIAQVALIVLFAVLVDYGEHAAPKKRVSSGNSSIFLPPPATNDISVYYPSKYLRLIKKTSCKIERVWKSIQTNHMVEDTSLS